jgi:hypothetical protein
METNTGCACFPWWVIVGVCVCVCDCVYLHRNIWMYIYIAHVRVCRLQATALFARKFLTQGPRLPRDAWQRATEWLVVGWQWWA